MPTRDLQLRIFDRLLGESCLRHKVVSIHTRGAERIAISRLTTAGVTAVLHWYTGSLGLIDEAVEAGMYFSVNPAMLRSDKGRRTICAIPRSRVLTESDGPFAKMAGRVSSPVDIPWTVAELAKYWEMKPDDAKRLVHENMTRLYASTVGSSDPAAGT